MPATQKKERWGRKVIDVLAPENIFPKMPEKDFP
jgi:hypothetical protein